MKESVNLVFSYIILLCDHLYMQVEYNAKINNYLEKACTVK